MDPTAWPGADARSHEANLCLWEEVAGDLGVRPGGPGAFHLLTYGGVTVHACGPDGLCRIARATMAVIRSTCSFVGGRLAVCVSSGAASRQRA